MMRRLIRDALADPALHLTVLAFVLILWLMGQEPWRDWDG